MEVLQSSLSSPDASTGDTVFKEDYADTVGSVQKKPGSRPESLRE
jgi:hypothetical protein